MGLLINGQVGWRAATVIAPSTPSLWTSVYAVYNADATGSSSLKTSLFAAYNGESNTNDSFGSNNGTAMGGLTYTTGKIGNAFNFNGTTSYVELGDVMDVGTSSWTYSFWFNASQLTSGNYYTLFAKSLASNSIGRIWGVMNGNKLEFSFATAALYPSVIIAQSISTFNINTWYHVVCVLDRSDKLKMYINGSLESVNTSQSDVSNNLIPLSSVNYNNNQPFRIGSYTAADNTTPFALFNGSIDAFNVWNRVLTQSEITELYNSGNGAQYITNDFYKPTPNDALNTYNGTAQGGLTYGVGKVGTAFNLNGTNAYVQLGDVMNLGLSSWSYSMWFNTNLSSTGQILFGKTYYGGLTGRFSAYLLNNKVNYFFDGGNGSANIVIETVNTISTNTWYNAVFVFDRSDKMKIYLNGVLQNVNNSGQTNNLLPYTSNNLNTNKPFRIGASTFSDSTTPVDFFKGQIDAFNVWNKVLTQSEITELYNSGNGKQYPN